MVVVLGVLCTGLAAVAMHRRAERAAVGLAIAAAVLFAVRLVLLPSFAIPGLLMAFPLLLVGVVGALAGPATADRRSTWLVLWVVAAGWGGRAAHPVRRGRASRSGAGATSPSGCRSWCRWSWPAPAPCWPSSPCPRARLVTVALVAGMVTLSLASLRELRRGPRPHRRRCSPTSPRWARQAGPDPVIVTDAAPLPRLDWDRFDDHRWLLADPAEVPDLPERLAAEGVDRWVLVSADGAGRRRRLRLARRGRPAVAVHPAGGARPVSPSIGSDRTYVRPGR